MWIKKHTEETVIHVVYNMSTLLKLRACQSEDAT